MNDTARIRAHIEMETEGERSPAQSAAAEEQAALDAMMIDTGINRYIEVRDSGRFMQIKRLTTSMLKHMSPLEKRLLRDWVDIQRKELDTKSALLTRHLTSDEPKIPALIRAGL